MPFTSQVSLSVGTTKLIPMSRVVTASATEILNYARHVQNSGSDVVAEEDLTKLLGKVLIESKFAASFKTRVNANSRLKTLAGSIMLHAGAGPTVLAAFKSNSLSGSFAMVVQCSFLCPLYQEDTIAAAIVAHYQRLDGSRTEDTVVDYPDQDNVRRVLTACQGQTVAVDWEQLLFDVAVRLNYVRDDHGTQYPDRVKALRPIHKTLFQGLLELLPLGSRFPSRHNIMVQSNRPPYSHGICATIAWVHHILGLNVHVYADEPAESMIISHELRPSHECSLEIRSDLDGLRQEDEPLIVLFDTSKSQPEELFTTRSSDEDVALESLRLSTARGYGTRKLIDEGSDGESGDVTMELTLRVCGLALLLMDRLQYRRVLTEDTEHPPNGVAIPGVSDEGMKKAFCGAANYLFDRDMSSDFSPFNHEAILNHRQAPPERLEAAPIFVRSHFEREGDPAKRRKVWWKMRIRVTRLARLLLALCHVNDITACEGLRFADSAVPNDLTRDSMSHPVSSVRPEAWMMMMMEYTEPGLIRDPHYIKRALSSRRGWSVRINTLDLLDPSNLPVGGICIEQGKPWCDGICKSHIFDASADLER
ncbi:hypothetical protein B0A48_12389 [Cryoendolithus antarcticus]|uniref:Uncharacterized protein n=1 Tax=Cryoendolithus antarcticus TaxID=1507870 RepID=A0A1V8SRY3_9PEZI|nr:hypothetical protein B0A48_12389 [Cryoendolithus antarcticus]